MKFKEVRKPKLDALTICILFKIKKCGCFFMILDYSLHSLINYCSIIENFKMDLNRKLFCWKKIKTYHEPKPFKQGTSNGKGSNFVKSIFMTRSEGKSTLINWFMSILISPGIGIVSGLLPPITTKSASSYPSALG